MAGRVTIQEVGLRQKVTNPKSHILPKSPAQMFGLIQQHRFPSCQKNNTEIIDWLIYNFKFILVTFYLKNQLKEPWEVFYKLKVE